MNQCVTCRYWKLSKEYPEVDFIYPYHPTTYDRADNITEVKSTWGHLVGVCTSPHVLFYERPTKNGATVMDGSQYMARLVTGEDFGCVLHEEVGF